LGAPTESSFRCARCAEKFVGGVEYESSCPNCNADMHTCTNCRFFDVSARNECREAVQERIAAKSKKNSCALFAARLVKDFARDSGVKSDDPKAAFDALFDL
jgi:hypothetical protein